MTVNPECQYEYAPGDPANHVPATLCGYPITYYIDVYCNEHLLEMTIIPQLSLLAENTIRHEFFNNEPYAFLITPDELTLSISYPPSKTMHLTEHHNRFTDETYYEMSVESPDAPYVGWSIKGLTQSQVTALFTNYPQVQSWINPDTTEESE